MDKEEVLENYSIANNAWLEARSLALKLIKPGASILDVATKVESKIKEIANIGFPINISRNYQAAHFTPNTDTKDLFEQDDLIKLDIGVHSSGYIIDAAFTIDLSKDNKNKALVDASKDGLNNAVEYVKQNGKNSTFSDIGRLIEAGIKNKGFKPILNLTGHSLGRYKVHAGASIFNYDTNNKNKIGTGMFAIEPFATSGSQRIRSGAECGIFFYNGKNNTRSKSGRELLVDIEPYEQMPFAERWIGQNMDPFAKKVALSQLAQERIISPAPVLDEDRNALVSQHEKTIIVFEDEVHVFPKIDY